MARVVREPTLLLTPVTLFLSPHISFQVLVGIMSPIISIHLINVITTKVCLLYIILFLREQL